MKQKLIALLILAIMIGIPLIGYWFFFVKNISGVSISFGENVTATVKLSGTFSYSWLPLADRALNFEKKCVNSCTFSPIAPARYELEIEADNHAKILDQFILANGDNLHKQYALTPTTQLITATLPSPITADELKLRNEDISTILGKNFQVIARDLNGRLWISESRGSATHIGFFHENQFREIANFPFHFEKIHFDFYNNAFIFWNKNSAFLMTSDGNNILETSLPEATFSVFFSEKMWHAVTPEQTFVFKNHSWQENIRFSHFADLGDTWRAGFIAQNDEKKMKISNFSPENGNALLLLNRKNGEVFEIPHIGNLSRFVIFENKIFVITDAGIFQIRLPNNF